MRKSGGLHRRDDLSFVRAALQDNTIPEGKDRDAFAVQRRPIGMGVDAPLVQGQSRIIEIRPYKALKPIAQRTVGRRVQMERQSMRVDGQIRHGGPKRQVCLLSFSTNA